ncbi:BT_3987 domain-containing protein [Niabella ginsenosidivorans]|nr:DUF1735 domain-containing protein [Niabella ginsenosidivorans]
MAAIRYFSLVYILGMLFTGCKQEINLPDQPLSDYIKVYMPQAANGPVTYNFSNARDTATIIYGADYGGQGYPSEDVSVSFAVNAALADSFNLANNTSYSLLPEKSYRLNTAAATIGKGRLSTEPLKITIITKGINAPDDLSKTYILPVTIKNASININEKLRTSFCIINIVPVLFNRKGWSVIDFSSQESYGEGANNGRAVFVLDSNINTFWHSQWQGAQPGPPHYIIIDIGASQSVSGAAFVARQGVNSGRPQDIQLFLSEDKQVWKTAFTGTLLNDGALQKVFFSTPVSGRYVKLQINSSYSSNLTHLAEFYLF